MSRAGVTSEHAERVMGHVLPGVEGVYDRHSYRHEKAVALAKLAALIGDIVAPRPKVVALRGRRQSDGSRTERRARETVRAVKTKLAWMLTKEGSREFYGTHMEATDDQTLVDLARDGDREALDILRKRARHWHREALTAGHAVMQVPTALHELLLEMFIYGPPKLKRGSGPKDTGLPLSDHRDSRAAGRRHGVSGICQRRAAQRSRCADECLPTGRRRTWHR